MKRKLLEALLMALSLVAGWYAFGPNHWAP